MSLGIASMEQNSEQFHLSKADPTQQAQQQQQQQMETPTVAPHQAGQEAPFVVTDAASLHAAALHHPQDLYGAQPHPTQAYPPAHHQEAGQSVHAQGQSLRDRMELMRQEEALVQKAAAAAATAQAAVTKPPGQGSSGQGGSGRSPQQQHRSSKYGFRFLRHERAILEKWYAEHEGRTAPITIRKEWVGVWNQHREQLKTLHCEVTHQQVKQWFENMRRTRSHKGGKGGARAGSAGRGGGLGAHGGDPHAAGAHPHQQQYAAGEQTSMNPRLYLAAATGKMHTAINRASEIVSQHFEQLQQITNSPMGLSPEEERMAAQAGRGASGAGAGTGGASSSSFRWDALNLKTIVDKLLVLLDSQIHNPSLPSPRTTASPQREFHFQVFKQMLDIDRQIEQEWDALKDAALSMDANPGNPQMQQHASELVDLYMMKLEHVITEKTKVMVSLISQLPVLPEPGSQSAQLHKAAREKRGAEGRTTYDPEDLQKHVAWTRSWTIPPTSAAASHRVLESKLCVFQGCFLNNEQRANFFLGVPMHASALASAVCFSLESGDSERLTSTEASNLVSLYEVAAVQELDLSDQLDKLWNLKPMHHGGEQRAAVDSWRLWIEDHHNPEIYYPLKVLADAVPAVDQQYGFISVTRNSLVLALGFLKGLRYALPLPLFAKCMINFTQAHYLFAAAAMLEELSDLVNDAPPRPQEHLAGQDDIVKKEGEGEGEGGLADPTNVEISAAATGTGTEIETVAVPAEEPPPAMEPASVQAEQVEPQQEDLQQQQHQEPPPVSAALGEGGEKEAEEQGGGVPGVGGVM